MAAIWTFDTEGYLWCTISDILYLENDLKMMEITLTECQCIHKRFFFTSFPSCLWIFIPSDKLWKWLLYAWIQELPLHHECHQITFLWDSHLSRSIIVHLQWQYLKWCNNQSLTELLITVSFRPINVFTTQLSLAWAGSWTPETTEHFGIIMWYFGGTITNCMITDHKCWGHRLWRFGGAVANFWII